MIIEKFEVLAHSYVDIELQKYWSGEITRTECTKRIVNEAHKNVLSKFEKKEL